MRMKSQPRPLANSSARSEKAFRKSSPSRLRENSSSEKQSTKAAAPRPVGGVQIQSLRSVISLMIRPYCPDRQYGLARTLVKRGRPPLVRAFELGDGLAHG